MLYSKILSSSVTAIPGALTENSPFNGKTQCHPLGLHRIDVLR